MPLPRTRTYVGRPRRRGNPRPAQKRRPYKRQNKKRFVAKRAPLVETKKKSSAGSLQFGEFYNVVIPDAYEVHQQGLLEENVIGSSIFAKYLNSQFQITFAQDAIQQLNQPIVLQVLHGWCKLPENIAPTKAPAGSPAGPYDGVVHDLTRLNTLSTILPVSSTLTLLYPRTTEKF